MKLDIKNPEDLKTLSIGELSVVIALMENLQGLDGVQLLNWIESNLNGFDRDDLLARAAFHYMQREIINGEAQIAEIRPFDGRPQ